MYATHSAFHKLTTKSSAIYDLLNEIHTLYQQMVSISANCFKVLAHYALFLRIVCQNYYNALEIYQSARGVIESMAVSKKKWEMVEEKLGSNSSTAVVIISANINDAGIVKSVNHELHEILGYDRNMVLNQNITALMPSLFSHTHSAAITQSFEANTMITKKERLVFPLHSLGYLVPSNIICKIIPTLENGIEIIGFISAATNVCELRNGEDKVTDNDLIILLLDQSYRLQAFNKKLLNYLSIPIKNVNIAKYHQSTQKIMLSKHMPLVFSSDALSQGLTSYGFSALINLHKFKIELLSEMFDLFFKEDNTANGSNDSISSELYVPNFTSNCSINLAENCSLDMQFNVKHKWYSLLDCSNAYMILTLTDNDGECTRKDVSDIASQKLLTAKNAFDEIQHRDQFNQCVNDNASVSQSSSSRM